MSNYYKCPSCGDLKEIWFEPESEQDLQCDRCGTTVNEIPEEELVPEITAHRKKIADRDETLRVLKDVEHSKVIPKYAEKIDCLRADIKGKEDEINNLKCLLENQEKHIRYLEKREADKPVFRWKIGFGAHVGYDIVYSKEVVFVFASTLKEAYGKAKQATDTKSDMFFLGCEEIMLPPK
jgi:DNA-directed RNA polymerase subunit RPC12/RpoP